MQVQIVVFTILFQCTAAHFSRLKPKSELKPPKSTYGITYGENTAISNYPCYCRIWILRTDGLTHFCGGTLVERNKVLSAAHCFFDAEQIYVCCGSAACQTNQGVCYFSETGRGVYVHEGYFNALLQDQMYDDIAFINTTGNFISATSNICAIGHLNGNLEGSSGTVIGCGRDETGILPANLRSVGQLVVPFTEGQTYFTNNDMKITPNYKVIFTKFPPNPRASSCSGDSGGGLFFRFQNQLTVAGLVSFGAVDCMLGTPSGFTYLEPYLAFIRNGQQAMSLATFKERSRTMGLTRQRDSNIDPTWKEIMNADYDNDGMTSNVQM